MWHSDESQWQSHLFSEREEEEEGFAPKSNIQQQNQYQYLGKIRGHRGVGAPGYGGSRSPGPARLETWNSPRRQFLTGKESPSNQSDRPASYYLHDEEEVDVGWDGFAVPVARARQMHGRETKQDMMQSRHNAAPLSRSRPGSPMFWHGASKDRQELWGQRDGFVGEDGGALSQGDFDGSRSDGCSYVETSSGLQRINLGVWADVNEFKNSSSRAGSPMADAKPHIPRSRGVSRRTLKKIQFFEPLSTELSDEYSLKSDSSVGSNLSGLNVSPAPRLRSVNSDTTLGLAQQTRAEIGSMKSPSPRMKTSQSFPAQFPRYRDTPDPSRDVDSMADEPDTFTDMGSGPDTATDTTSIATLKEYTSNSDVAESAILAVYNKGLSPAAELAKERLVSSNGVGKLQAQNHALMIAGNANDTTATGSSLTTDAEDGAQEYTSIVERLKQGELGLGSTTPLSAAREVRSAAKHSEIARKALSEAGAIPPLLRLLMPDHEMGTRHTAALALLNLAIGCTRNKLAIHQEGGVPLLIDLLRPQSPISLRESATAVVLSLAASDSLKPHLEPAIPQLVDVLKNGTTEGRYDACRALLNLSIFKPHRSKILAAGAIPPLYMLIQRDSVGAGDKALLLLSHLYMTTEGREAVAAAPETLHVLLHVLKVGSQGSKEQAAGILLSLSSDAGFRKEIVAAEGVLPSLVEMALLGSQKAQETASRLLEMMKSNRKQGGAALADSQPLKPRRRRATSLSGVEDLASKVKEAEVAAAVNVVASAIEEASSPDEDLWPDERGDESQKTPTAPSTDEQDDVLPSQKSPLVTDSLAEEMGPGPPGHVQLKKASHRRRGSFSGGWGSTHKSDEETPPNGSRPSPVRKSSPKSVDGNASEGKSRTLFLGLRSLWASRRRWKSGCKASVP